jgi:hypothetical protein
MPIEHCTQEPSWLTYQARISVGKSTANLPSGVALGCEGASKAMRAVAKGSKSRTIEVSRWLGGKRIGVLLSTTGNKINVSGHFSEIVQFSAVL